tara:strand:- start:1006 stop:1305 length:300 start_codon:yes stop_codon:yes gene_type:complete
MRKKIKAEKEKSLQIEDLPKEEVEEKEEEQTEAQIKEQHLSLTRQLCHQGELGYQVLAKWEATNQSLELIYKCLRHLVEQGKERNEILKEEEDFEEDEE